MNISTVRSFLTVTFSVKFDCLIHTNSYEAIRFDTFRDIIILIKFSLLIYISQNPRELFE